MMRLAKVRVVGLDAPVGAQTRSVTCPADTLGQFEAQSRKLSGARHAHARFGRMRAPGSLRLRDIAIWGAKVRMTDAAADRRVFLTFSAQNGFSNAFLFSAHVHGFTVTQRGGFGCKTSSGMNVGGPGACFVTDPPCDGLPLGDE